MKRIHALILALVIVGIVLSIAFTPSSLFFLGFGFLVSLWIAQGGLVDGNPYKRMTYTALPDFLEVKDYMMKEDIEVRDTGSWHTAVFMFVIGLVYLAIGLAWVLLFW